MGEDKKYFLLIGLPETGKTSFLAALYYYLTCEISDRRLIQYKPSSNARYLNKIMNTWIRCEKIDRTVSQIDSSNREVVLHLQDVSDATKFDLQVPDIAGEHFVHQFTNRIWEKSYKDEVENSSGMILFLNPEKIRPHVLIDDVQLNDDLFEEPEELEPFKIEEVPTQIMLVDILNYHFLHQPNSPIPLSLVISAWDEVQASEKISPSNWVRVNLPLLNQYLISNPEKFKLKIFGVSAQGGKISDPAQKSTLTSLDEPGERFIIQEEDSINKNICAPLEWLIRQ